MSEIGITRTVIWTKLHAAIKEEFKIDLPTKIEGAVFDVVKEIAAELCSNQMERLVRQVPSYRWEATDKNGNKHKYTDKPYIRNNLWWSNAGVCVFVDNVECDNWQESLVEINS